MGSFALWFEGTQEDTNNIKAEVHFNLWNLHYKKAQPTSLDIGVKLINVKRESILNFYVPFDIEKEEIIDLGDKLKSSDILCAVFNEDYTLSRVGTEKILYVKNQDNVDIMSIYCLDIVNDVILTKCYDGSLIKIKINDTFRQSNETIYYRFRIKSRNLQKIIKYYQPKNKLIQSAFSITEAIDFRFNDYRSLNPSLLEVMKMGFSYNISKVHFLLLLESEIELNFSSYSVSARELENNTWSNYFQELGTENIVAYHWKFKENDSTKLIENCIMFVKAKVYKCNWSTILIYLITLSFINFVITFLSELLKKALAG